MLSLIYFTHLRALTEPVLSRSLDCLQWPQPRGFACKKEQVLSYCWLNTARVLAGVLRSVWLIAISHAKNVTILIEFTSFQQPQHIIALIQYFTK